MKQNCLLHILLNRYYVSFNMRWKGSFKTIRPITNFFIQTISYFIKEPQQQSKIKLLPFLSFLTQFVYFLRATYMENKEEKYEKKKDIKKNIIYLSFAFFLWKFISYMFRLWLLFHTYAPKYHTSLNRKWMCHDVFTSMHKWNYKHVDFL